MYEHQARCGESRVQVALEAIGGNSKGLGDVGERALAGAGCLSAGSSRVQKEGALPDVVMTMTSWIDLS